MKSVTNSVLWQIYVQQIYGIYGQGDKTHGRFLLFQVDVSEPPNR
jgi:hypothetical protein